MATTDYLSLYYWIIRAPYSRCKCIYIPCQRDEQSLPRSRLSLYFLVAFFEAQSFKFWWILICHFVFFSSIYKTIFIVVYLRQFTLRSTGRKESTAMEFLCLPFCPFEAEAQVTEIASFLLTEGLLPTTPPSVVDYWSKSVANWDWKRNVLLTGLLSMVINSCRSPCYERRKA